MRGRPGDLSESPRPSRADSPENRGGEVDPKPAATDSVADSRAATGRDPNPADTTAEGRSSRGRPDGTRESTRTSTDSGPSLAVEDTVADEPSTVRLADLERRSGSSSGFDRARSRGDDYDRDRSRDDNYDRDRSRGDNYDRYRSNRLSAVALSPSGSRHWDSRWTSRDNFWGRHSRSSSSNLFISLNFGNSINYAYYPTAWGSYPWWSSRNTHSWHCGSWNYRWNYRWHNRYYYYSRPVIYYPPGYHPYYYYPSSIIPWGLASWSLGSLYYDTGYSTYWNPYPAPPIQTRTTIVNYSQPITVVAREYVPTPEEIALNPAEKSSAALERSRESFKRGDYLAASKEIDEAISFEPGDPALHEYRALVLFALGRYGDAAGVLNPVLASGPGWDWETMIGLYPSADTYTGHFRKLEEYVTSMPDSADAHFLLGYHYLVGGHLKESYAMFDRVHVLQPADSVARQLRALVADSIPTDGVAAAAAVGTEMAEVKKAPVARETLFGVWKAASADGKMITLSLTEIGTFSWNFEGAAAGEVLSGEWSINEDGFLVLAGDDVQLVGDITLRSDQQMHFLLAGSPEGDPGLLFDRN